MERYIGVDVHAVSCTLAIPPTVMPLLRANEAPRARNLPHSKPIFKRIPSAGDCHVPIPWCHPASTALAHHADPRAHADVPA
jgi:hypothetical protein